MKNVRPVIITAEVRSRLGELKAYARAHPFTVEDILAKASIGKAVGDAPEFSAVVPIGVRMVLSYEFQRPGPLWHASFSVDIPGRVPNPYAVDLILKETGLPPIKEALSVWEEAVGQGVTAMNLVWFDREQEKEFAA